MRLPGGGTQAPGSFNITDGQIAVDEAQSRGECLPVWGEEHVQVVEWAVVAVWGRKVVMPRTEYEEALKC